MLTTYHGILKGDRIQWDQDAPKDLRADQPVQVFVTILEESKLPEMGKRSNGKKMAEALERLAESGNVLSAIPNPVAWEREQRKDRKLPGRPN